MTHLRLFSTLTNDRILLQVMWSVLLMLYSNSRLITEEKVSHFVNRIVCLALDVPIPKEITVNSVQVRRITVGEISDDAPGTPLSFTKMMSVASSFVIPEPKDNAAERSNFLATAKATYFDETGEEITMTTDSELNVAFAQHLNGVANNAHFRIIVSIPKD